MPDLSSANPHRRVTSSNPRRPQLKSANTTMNTSSPSSSFSPFSSQPHKKKKKKIKKQTYLSMFFAASISSFFLFSFFFFLPFHLSHLRPIKTKNQRLGQRIGCCGFVNFLGASRMLMNFLGLCFKLKTVVVVVGIGG